MKNLLTEVPSGLAEELIEPLAEGSACRVERIVSHGHTSPDGFWYNQEQAEWVVVLQGAARLEFEDGAEAVEMRPGDWIDIPANRKHRVAWTTSDEPTVWLAVHYE